MKYVILLSILPTLLFACSNAEQPAEASFEYSYNIKADLQPYEHLLTASGTMTFDILQDNTDSIVFYLYHGLDVKSMTGNHVVDYTYVQDSVGYYKPIPDGAPITIRFKNPLKEGDKFSIDFEYAGEITQTRFPSIQFDGDWVELGWMCPWFPYNPDYPLFTFSLDIGIDTAYTVVTIGETEKRVDRWSAWSKEPVNDILVTAARGLKTVERNKEDCHAKLHYKYAYNAPIDSILNDAIWFLQTYQDWFDGNREKDISILIAPRQSGGGYSRTGFIVYRVTERNYTYQDFYFMGISNEIARIWWHNAPVNNWENWLNESFATYSTMMAVRERFGEQDYNALIYKKSGFVKRLNLPPIAEFDPAGVMSFPILYNKGPVLLHKLAVKIGNERFIALLKELIKTNVGSTAEFLNVVERMEGIEVRQMLEKDIYG
ncbi:MAG: hypothetical protein GF315_01855 [candidate division Zixibacteria bacterium]|nr:hypothetical protein [candidate division Zixibacteria bacterium]